MSLKQINLILKSLICHIVTLIMMDLHIL